MTRAFDGALDAALKGELRAAGIVYGLSIGRRAPLHRMHLGCILEIAAAGLKPVIVVGSANAAGDALYDPLKNPLTLEQQVAQVGAALPAGLAEQCLIFALPDRQDDADWMAQLKTLLDENGLSGKSIMHFRAKAADAVTADQARCRPLGQYKRDLMAMGLAVWQSYNRDEKDDLINASDIRGHDVGNLTPEQAAQLAAPVQYAQMVRAARATNPDRALLAGIPQTALDLALDRLRRETGTRTRDIVAAAKLRGTVSHATLLAATKDRVERLKRKPLIVIGPRMGRETGAALARDERFEFAPVTLGVYQSGETFCELLPQKEEDFAVKAERLQDAEVFVVQSTAAPVGDNVQHLLHMTHSLKHYGAGRVTAVLPFAAYARQDRAFTGKFASVGADMLPRQLKAAGVDRVISVTMHSKAAVGFYKAAFGKNFTHVSTADLFSGYLKAHPRKDIVIGAPDGGEKLKDEGIARAAAVARAFNNAAMFKISKVHTAASDTKVTAFAGDVRGKTAVVVDDMVDGGSTLVNAARVLKQNGATEVVCCVTHALLTASDKTALEKLLLAAEDGQPLIDRLAVTDSVPDVREKLAAFAQNHPRLAAKVAVLPLAPLLAEAMQPKPAMARQIGRKRN